MPTPIDPSFSTTGPEWQIQPLEPAARPAGGSSFGGALGQAIQSLEQSQEQAADAARSLAEGTATDPTQVVLAVERARLSMQLASQIRAKAVEAYQDVFHTQV